MELSKHRDDRVALKEELSLLTAQFQEVNGKCHAHALRSSSKRRMTYVQHDATRGEARKRKC